MQCSREFSHRNSHLCSSFSVCKFGGVEKCKASSHHIERFTLTKAENCRQHRTTPFAMTSNQFEQFRNEVGCSSFHDSTTKTFKKDPKWVRRCRKVIQAPDRQSYDSLVQNRHQTSFLLNQVAIFASSF